MSSKQALLVLVAVGGALLIARKLSTETDEQTMIDDIGQTMDQALGMLAPGPAADMYPSEELRDMLKNREVLRLERYNLGDGGWTIGYGHWDANINNVPARITRDDAEAMFDRDLYDRAYKWVRLYVSVPVNQYQFDALTHIAFNLSPKGFKRFADAVNAGEGIDAIADASVYWAAAQFQSGIRARRATEVALFNDGVYA